MEFSEYNERLQSFVSDLNENMRLVVEANEKPLVDINREQLLVGTDIEGNTIEPPLRSFSYAKAKKDTGGKAPFWIPDLFLTGSFQSEMILETEDKSYFITSTDEKTEKLTRKYKGLFGISEQNQSRAQEINTRKLGEMLSAIL